MVEGFEFHRGQVVQRFVDSLVVEPADVVEGRPLDVFDVALETLAVNQFALVETVE